jgi:transcriptional regulator with XRE-family HTH domain
VPKSTFTEQYRSFCRTLVQARNAAGFTQRQVAARLNKPPSYVARVETGQRRLDVVEFFEFARAIDADPFQILHDVPDL